MVALAGAKGNIAITDHFAQETVKNIPVIKHLGRLYSHLKTFH